MKVRVDSKVGGCPRSGPLVPALFVIGLGAFAGGIQAHGLGVGVGQEGRGEDVVVEGCRGMSSSERERILMGLVDLAGAYRDGNAEEGERLLCWFVGRPKRNSCMLSRIRLNSG